VNIRFPCPLCEYAGRFDVPGAAEWRCPACDHLLRPAFAEPPDALPVCAICGNHELYKKKDFPHGLGLTILAVACTASLISFAYYQLWLTWTFLIGSAVFDSLLYLWVGDVVVCYRCGAHYRGLKPGGEHKPFELGIAERYRQEKIRREELARKK
jgi:hypothetical protein